MSGRRLITKFFEPEDRHYFLNGSIKFGTLNEYRSAENRKYLGARIDEKEGFLEEEFIVRAIDQETKLYVSGAFDISMTNSTFSGAAVKIINEWVFCSSDGDYTSELHAGILYGRGTYKGNPALQDFCVFDLEKLIPALLVELRGHREFEVRGPEPYLFSGCVNYGKSPIKRDVTGQNYNHSVVIGSAENYLRTVYAKPEDYYLENEFRLLARIKAPKGAPLNAKAVCVQSQRIRDAIVRFR